MGLFDRVERKLDRVINGAFARAFKAEVQPVEIASEMRRAMDERAAVVARGRTIVPNSFTIELDPDDYDRLTQYENVLVDELIASVAEHAETQHYRPGGPFHVDFTMDDSLDTGVFRVRSRTTQDAADRRDAAEPSARARRAPDVPARPEPGRRPRNSWYPAEATARPEGDVAAAGKASAAAAGAAAGTAAAARAGHLWEETGHDGDRGRHRDDAPGSWGRAGSDPTATVVAGRPVEPVQPRLDASHRPWLDIDGEAYPLLGAITVIGRDPDADITLDDSGVSRRHCEIRVTHDGPHLVVGLRDLDSTNGTFVNGDRVETARLRDGDRVTIGRVRLDLRTRGR